MAESARHCTGWSGGGIGGRRRGSCCRRWGRSDGGLGGRHSRGRGRRRHSRGGCHRCGGLGRCSRGGGGGDRNGRRGLGRSSPDGCHGGGHNCRGLGRRHGADRRLRGRGGGTRRLCRHRGGAGGEGRGRQGGCRGGLGSGRREGGRGGCRLRCSCWRRGHACTLRHDGGGRNSARLRRGWRRGGDLRACKGCGDVHGQRSRRGLSCRPRGWGLGCGTLWQDGAGGNCGNHRGGPLFENRRLGDADEHRRGRRLAAGWQGGVDTTGGIGAVCGVEDANAKGCGARGVGGQSGVGAAGARGEHDGGAPRRGHVRLARCVGRQRHVCERRGGSTDGAARSARDVCCDYERARRAAAGPAAGASPDYEVRGAGAKGGLGGKRQWGRAGGGCRRMVFATNKTRSATRGWRLALLLQTVARRAGGKRVWASRMAMCGSSKTSCLAPD
jgi:hypothetical protein